MSDQGIPPFGITGCFPDRPDDTGDDDWLTVDLIECDRTGRPIEASGSAAQLRKTMEASRTLALGSEHCDPLDIEFASRIDRFDFAMKVTTDDLGRRLEAR